jgi:enoyl-CoA hydratase/carnithine racemase
MDTSLFSLRDQGDVSVVQFNPREGFHTAGVRPVRDAFLAFEQSQLDTKRIVVFRTPKGYFSPHLVDDFWRRAKKAPIENVPVGAPCRPNMVGLVDSTVQRALTFIRSLPAWTIIACEGEIDFDFLGLLLACNYRICSPDTRFANHTLRRNAPPGSAAPWFLVRLLGYPKARQLYLDEVTLSAAEAMELGIVDRVSEPDSLDKDALAVAEHFQQFDQPALDETVRAFQLTDLDLLTYLQQAGTGFDRVPK